MRKILHDCYFFFLRHVGLRTASPLASPLPQIPFSKDQVDFCLVSVSIAISENHFVVVVFFSIYLIKK